MCHQAAEISLRFVAHGRAASAAVSHGDVMITSHRDTAQPGHTRPRTRPPPPPPCLEGGPPPLVVGHRVQHPVRVRLQRGVNPRDGPAAAQTPAHHTDLNTKSEMVVARPLIWLTN